MKLHVLRKYPFYARFVEIMFKKQKKSYLPKQMKLLKKSYTSPLYSFKLGLIFHILTIEINTIEADAFLQLYTKE